MKPTTKILAAIILAIWSFTATLVTAQHKEGDDKTLSPYFFVKSDNPDIDQLPLKSTAVAVNIAGVIADVKVTQAYKNEGKHALEAIYIFPASTRAAVYAMKMIVGERVISAKIKRRDQARQEYEQAKQQGKSASLLEQQRPNVFQMNVANIMPGDDIRVEMSYTELLVPTDKEYEFVYPTVVGPRYSNQNASNAPAPERWSQNPYLHQGEAPTSIFDLTVNINAGMVLQKIVSPSHKVDIRYSGNTTAAVTLDKTESSGGNRDYILKYRLAGDKVESGLLLSQGEKENFFLLMLQPPKRVALEQIPGREYIFIVDVSGSMNGFPLEISKKLVKDLIGNLRSTDRFNVVLFAGGNSVLSEHSLPATPENIARAIMLIEQQQGGGGTELLPALKRAIGLPRNEKYSRSVVIATDGYVTVEEEVFDLIRNNLGNANMFAFGIGSSVNRHIIEGMAHVGMGEPFVILRPEEAPAKAEAFRKLIQSPVLTQVKVTFDGLDVYDVEPRSIPDVLADRPVIVFGKWRGTPRGKIMLQGISGREWYRDEINVVNVKLQKDNASLQHLWARHRITMLSDYNLLRSDDKRIEEVTELGLAYNLLTGYTSFVAVDSEVRNKEGKTTTVNQPLPLPEGVSDHAVGGNALAAAAPAKMMLYRQQKAAPAESAGLMGSGLQDKREKKKDAVQLTVREITAQGGLSRDAVRMTVEQQAKSLRGCIPTTQVSAKIKIKLTIDAKGSIKNVEILFTEIKDKAVEECLRRTLKGWKFDASSSGSETEAVIALQVSN